MSITENFEAVVSITANFEAAVHITANFEATVSLLQILKLQWALLQISWFCNLYSSIPSQNTSSSTPFQNVIISARSCFLWCDIPTVPLEYTRGAEIFPTNAQIHCRNLCLNTAIYCVWTLLYIASEHCYILCLNTAIYCAWTLLYIAPEICYILCLNIYILRLNTIIYCGSTQIYRV